MSDYEVQIRVRNNNILQKLKIAGYSSIPKFCQAVGINAASLYSIINMKLSPLTTGGKFRDVVVKVCEHLKCAPEELFSEAQINAELKTNKRTLEVNEAELRFLLETQKEPISLEHQIIEEENNNALDKALGKYLTPREEKVMRFRYGLSEDGQAHTLRECALLFEVGQERIRQIEAKALRKLRHPTSGLKEIFGEENQRLRRCLVNNVV